ncbi:hypothetical protein BC937DRAFT_87631 [Endogone sp. FLAS-F59071]|nr:hypothetical protein BC937DRAFT_87631 [Endogone sp. FLAS-F59071]|eukprot:RUS12532.1 hypothetical protein BC937DRAFT_87631 [Endogone sp. FLAS-F59071]
MLYHKNDQTARESNSELDKPGFSYFTETPSSEWDTLAYHESWRIHGFPLVKSTLTRKFKTQVDWFLEHGLPAEKRKAETLKNQFKVFVSAGREHGIAASHGTSSPAC